MRRYLPLLFLLLHFCVNAQDIIPSVDFNVERGYRFQQALKSGNDLVVIYGRSDWFFYSSRIFVRIHNADGSIVSEKKLELKANNQPAYLLHAFVNYDDLFFVCAVPFNGKSESSGWCVLKFNKGNVTKSFEVVAGNAIPKSWLLNGYVTTAASADSSRMTVCVTSPSRPETVRKINALTFSVNNPSNFNIVSATLPYASKRYELLELLPDINGTLFLLGKYYGSSNSEIVNAKPNYTYTLHRGDGGTLEEVCEIPQRGSMVRSIGGVVMNNIFFGCGLASDSTLASNDSVYTVRIPLGNCGEAITSVSALPHPPAVGNAFPNRFSNKSLWINNKLVTFFELHHIEYNESAKQGEGFTYERGAAIITTTSVQGKLDDVKNIYKWQRFSEIPTNSFQSFHFNKNLFAAFVESRDDDKRFSKLRIINLETDAEMSFTISNIDWERENQYHMFRLGSRLVTLQSKSRNYSLFIAPLQ